MNRDDVCAQAPTRSPVLSTGFVWCINFCKNCNFEVFSTRLHNIRHAHVYMHALIHSNFTFGAHYHGFWSGRSDISHALMHCANEDGPVVYPANAFDSCLRGDKVPLGGRQNLKMIARTFYSLGKLEDLPSGAISLIRK